MLKTIKKLLFLLSFFTSSIFPMTRLAQALLIRKTLNQTSSFHSSLQTKCPLGPISCLFMVEEVPKVQENAQINNDACEKDIKIHRPNDSMFAMFKDRPNYLQMTEQRHSNQYLDSKPIYWDQKFKNPQTLNNNSSPVQKHSRLDLSQEICIATIKSQIHNLASNFTAMIKHAVKHIATKYYSLSHHEALAQKEVLIKELTSLKNMLMLAIQKNPDAYLIINSYKLDQNSLITDHTLDRLTAKDFMNALTILKLEFEIARASIAIKECDIIIQKVEHAIQKFINKIEGLSIDIIENSIYPWLIEEQRQIHVIISQEKCLIEDQIKKLQTINAKLEPFTRGSIWAKIGCKFNLNHDQTSLDAAKEKAEAEIKDANHRLQYLYDKNRINHAHLQSVQKKLDGLHKEQNESKQNQEINFSSQAQALIAHTNAHFIGLDRLSYHDQKQVTDLVNRAAQDQKNINDASCDELITTTIEVADSACQAFLAGKSEFGDALVNFGNTVLDCATAFSKGLAHGVCKSIQSNWQAAKDPIHTLTNFAKGVAHLAGCLHPIGAAVVIGSNIASAINNLEQALQGATQKLNDMPLTEIFETLGEKIGEFGTDLLILDGALKSASIVKNIAVAEAAIIIKKAEQGLAELGEFAKTEITALTESKEVLVKTAEGFEVAIDAKRADIAKETQALHSEANAFNKTKNGLKSEGATARASKGTTQFGPNGGYSDAGYHHIQSTGKIKSRGPKSGIEAVNNSAEVLNKGGIQHKNKQRIGISDGEFVVLNRTHKGATRAEDIFHGHVREWKDLKEPMKNALKDAGLVDKNGKILKK